MFGVCPLGCINPFVLVFCYGILQPLQEVKKCVMKCTPLFFLGRDPADISFEFVQNEKEQFREWKRGI